jgi:hypothetical protein
MERRLTVYQNRLTVVGRTRAFQNGDWLAVFSGRYAEPLEFGSTRCACQFETTDCPLPALRRLSRSHPGLIFLLDYETERIKGLAKAKAGRLIHHQIRY